MSKWYFTFYGVNGAGYPRVERMVIMASTESEAYDRALWFAERYGFDDFANEW